jgi:hypothetical protein
VTYKEQIKRRQVMKTQANRKIIAVAAAVMLGLATTGGAALAPLNDKGERTWQWHLPGKTEV